MTHSQSIAIQVWEARIEEDLQRDIPWKETWAQGEEASKARKGKLYSVGKVTVFVPRQVTGEVGRVGVAKL